MKWSGYGPNPRTEQVAVNETETITLAATAIASPAATFAWRKNGKPIEGATDAVLRLGNLSSDDTATYIAVATNSEGSVSSNSAVLVVTPRTASIASLLAQSLARVVVGVDPPPTSAPIAATEATSENPAGNRLNQLAARFVSAETPAPGVAFAI